MFLERIKTDGLAHLSYVFGDGGEACVVDPRRDVQIYLDIAGEHEHRITTVLETHRNEDLVTGSVPLAERTGAAVRHGPHPDAPIDYAETIREGDELRFGGWRVRVLETPGHTDDSVSYVLFDDNFGGSAVGVFTGDALFVGDVGRTDFYPDRAEEVAGLLHDSLGKILALGDQAQVFPAHGAGSVCGGGLAEREFTTVGYEREHNPMLQIRDREEFIRAKVAEHHYKPPYFERMERINSRGASPVETGWAPPRLSPGDMDALRPEPVLVDVRGTSAFLGAHLPGSLSLPMGMIGAYGGWLLEPDQDLVLVAADARQATTASLRLLRMGYDGIRGYLSTGMASLAAQGRELSSAAVVDTAELADRLGHEADWSLLDVRKRDEWEKGVIDGSLLIYLGHLPRETERLERGRHYTVMCDTGVRAAVAASWLERNNFTNLDVYLGSMGAWRQAGRKTVNPLTGQPV